MILLNFDLQKQFNEIIKRQIFLPLLTLNCTNENKISRIIKADKFACDSCRCDCGMSGDNKTLSTQCIQSKNVLKKCHIVFDADKSGKYI